MDFNTNQDPIEQNGIEEKSEMRIKGVFFKRKMLYGILLFFLGILVFYLFSGEIFSKEENEGKKEVQEKEQTNVEEVEANYEDVPTDVGYEEKLRDAEGKIITEEDLNREVIDTQENSEEIEYQKGKRRELEEEAIQAMRSPSSITIATRPQINNRNVVLTPGGGNTPVTDYDGNRQESKRNFLNREKSQKFYQLGELVDPVSEYELKAGDFIPAVMLQAINSDLPTKGIVAQVAENVMDTVTGKYLLIPQGTKIIGTYDSSITFGQERLLVVWQRLIFPNGRTILLENMQGIDLSGKAGLNADVNNHFATLLKGVILSSLMGSAAAITTDRKKDWRGAAAEGAGEQIISIGDRIAEKNLSRQPTLSTKPGDRFNIFVHADLVLEPYKIGR
ncbi:bacterial conjugation TrbI-like protein [Fusobacterium necrophorum subsp. funduliforme ATCC 51357]|uniref:TrbI/VirB10 family protein n=1 Tax=Fusobacterium necrophorum TaxID=859 RepID=UPI0001BC4A4B|nr:TrbI/VirB10 family protein [Fusobacterium necrophorum]EFS22951.1 bacterial conjugation TrbI-like protein [Fusobacterium necrophorum D12]EIJ68705.1 bacterial conjugation TrbI-like protein [Fusobacterium necrophorum subsp. funduliforme ATCC 51357]KAB0552955.1 TrbI/VirB10 family protein [Fusobacterium necrophorum subsp. funduliforme]